MIFDMVIYVTLINLTEMECILLLSTVTYCHTNIEIWNFTPEMQLSIAFYYHVSIKCSIMV